MYAHAELYEGGECHQGEDGGERHVEREVGVVTIRALVLDHAVAGAIETLPVSGAVTAALRHLSQEPVVGVVTKQMSSYGDNAHDAS